MASTYFLAEWAITSFKNNCVQKLTTNGMVYLTPICHDRGRIHTLSILYP